MADGDGVDSIRETMFAVAIGARILDITSGDFGEEDQNRIYFHLDNGQTFFTTIGDDQNPSLMGFLDMEADDAG